MNHVQESKIASRKGCDDQIVVYGKGDLRLVLSHQT